MAKRLTYQQIRELDPAEVGKMSAEDIRNLLGEARKKYSVRAKSLKRVSDKIYSPALEAMERYYEDVGVQSTENVSRNRAYNELFKIRKFFNAKSSDVKEARKINIEQDKMLFGVTKSGRAKFRMDTMQRKKFWDLYDDFTEFSKTAETAFGYQNIWSELATIVVEQPYLINDKLAVFNLLENRLNHEKSERREGFDKDTTAFSGSWDGI